MINSKRLYEKLSELCIQKELLTQEQSNTICRKGHRKEWAWKRHIIDLCDFVLWKMKDDNVQDSELKELLEQSILFCKNDKKI